MEQVVLVDELDNPTGLMEKMEAHRRGVLHRAFSVFVFNDNDELLLQKRAGSKYHSGGLWTNTCCSHPRADESPLEGAKRRLMEEMGFDCEINKAFDFIYRSTLDNQLIEHEFDHVFFGRFSASPKPNPEEVEDWKYMSIPDIRMEMTQHPYHFTEWFKICFDKVADLKSQ
jgi:isopentenyl-diphosphate delta-isomerase